ncbi:unnamed protein product [Cylicocyclus nassatus]|uniref:Uncharacterized protein n=1 Tax=Cylicocyclus nassatus TaxID=53992 RepID=A0AA36HCK2_CYLNA|nr:unnamed protein product [Cylicocyclus nassatus]
MAEEIVAGITTVTNGEFIEKPRRMERRRSHNGRNALDEPELTQYSLAQMTTKSIRTGRGKREVTAQEPEPFEREVTPQEPEPFEREVTPQEPEPFEREVTPQEPEPFENDASSTQTLSLELDENLPITSPETVIHDDDERFILSTTSQSEAVPGESSRTSANAEFVADVAITTFASSTSVQLSTETEVDPSSSAASAVSQDSDTASTVDLTTEEEKEVVATMDSNSSTSTKKIYAGDVLADIVIPANALQNENALETATHSFKSSMTYDILLLVPLAVVCILFVIIAIVCFMRHEKNHRKKREKRIEEMMKREAEAEEEEAFDVFRELEHQKNGPHARQTLPSTAHCESKNIQNKKFKAEVEKKPIYHASEATGQKDVTFDFQSCEKQPPGDNYTGDLYFEVVAAHT